MFEKVSVIVPIYKVEKYIKECIESIINQSYKNLEIILIDDGTPDNCGIICDDYSIIDKRIRVIHKKNGGLSSARNAGLDIATGGYILFVDSDDTISTNMIFEMVEVSQKYNADIVCCDFGINSLKKCTDSEQKIYAMSKEQAIINLFDEVGYKFYAWNKLYKSEILKNIRFPEGRIYEDIKTIYLAFKQANNIVYLKKELYAYRIRQDSITNSEFSNKIYDLVHSINFVINDIQKEKSLYKNTISGYIRYYCYFINNALINNSNIKEELNYIRKIIRSNLFTIILTNKISISRKVQFIILLMNKNLYKKLLILKEKK